MEKLKSVLGTIITNQDGTYRFTFYKSYYSKRKQIKFKFPTKLEAITKWEELRIIYNINSKPKLPLKVVIPEGWFILHPPPYPVNF